MARDARDAKFTVAPPSRRAALERLRADVGSVSATWDAATDVPQHLLLGGMPTPDAVADPVAAASVARDMLSRHLALLAPGASASDFALVSNDLSSGVRSVGFVQHHRGMPVLGGQVSFRFKHDRLVMITSGAYPNIVLPTRGRTATDREVLTHARGWIADDVAGSQRNSGSVEGPFVLPLVDAAGTVEYREVLRTHVDVKSPASAWTVYVDAASGAPVAREQTLLFGTSQVSIAAPERNPQSPPITLPASSLGLDVGGTPDLADAGGVYTYPGPSVAVATSLQGPFAEVFDDNGPVNTWNTTLQDGVGWVIAGTNESTAAQASAYGHTMLVKNFVRGFSDIPWLDDPIPVTVNIGDTCNAFSDGNSINFFASGGGCENTALLADVVYHEFGHSLHSQSLVPGIGQFNVSLSEGISDYLSATITNDPGLAPGFFMDDTPLRQLDPSGFEYRWPEDRGEVHDEGRIIGGALWDLRKAMVKELGPVEGPAYVDRLFYETTRRAVDIPSMYPEALLFDDDDGDLSNGTPNACIINAAYGPHGLFNPGARNEAVSIADDIDGSRVTLSLSLPNFPACPIAANPTVVWRVRGTSDTNELAAAPQPDGTYAARIPLQEPGTVIEYQVRPGYDIDSERSLPDNIVDPWYQHYVGEVIELGCIDQDTGFTASENWTVGPWTGDNSGSDPFEGFNGGTHIWQPGDYPRFIESTIEFDAIDTGPYTQVRLQLWRWLAVEDGFFDQATLRVNGQELWRNQAATDDYLASFHHVDREWRFVDFDISDRVGPGGVSLGFSTTADGGLEFGGWSLANVCVVAVDGPTSSCGNGVLEAPEGCDDGNVVDGDGCDATCQPEDDPAPPVEPEDPDTDGDEDTDTDAGDTDTASFDGDGLIDRGCACNGGGSGAPVGAAFALLLLGLRRRRW